jgi:hypothetical protein
MLYSIGPGVEKICTPAGMFQDIDALLALPEILPVKVPVGIFPGLPPGGED